MEGAQGGVYLFLQAPLSRSTRVAIYRLAAVHPKAPWSRGNNSWALLVG
jgi:hypothetical protein